MIETCVPSMANATLTATRALAEDPVSGLVYAVVGVAPVAAVVQPDRLVTVDPTTCAYTNIGDLSDLFASLTFALDELGISQLIGVTDKAADVRESIFLINKANGTTTYTGTLGAGDVGEQIQFNPNDGFTYHWSDNSDNGGTRIFENFTIPGEPFPTLPTLKGIGTSPLLAPNVIDVVTATWWNTIAGACFLVIDRSLNASLLTTNGFVTPVTPAPTLPGRIQALALAPAGRHDVVPSSGSVDGGYTVTLHKSDSSSVGAATVNFGGEEVAFTEFADRLEVNAPGGVLGTVDITCSDSTTVLAWRGQFSYTQ